MRLDATIVGLVALASSIVALLAFFGWRTLLDRQRLQAMLQTLEKQAEELRQKAVSSDEGRPDPVAELDGNAKYQAPPEAETQPTREGPLNVPKALVEACTRAGVILFAGQSDLLRDGAPTGSRNRD